MSSRRDGSLGTRRITVLSTGGTIAEEVGSGTHELGAERLVSLLPAAVRERVDVRGVAWRAMRSLDLSLAGLLDIEQAVRRELDAGADGVVVSHGTDALEELAFALDLLLGASARVVVTGAMRQHGAAGYDGTANLAAAIDVAVSEEAAEVGVSIVLDGVIHAARFAEKVHTASSAAFESRMTGPIGWVSEDVVRIVAVPRPREPIELSSRRDVPKVAILKAFLGSDAAVVDAFARLGYDGLVVEGFGGGHVPAAMVPALEALARDTPVVVTSRVGAGPLLAGHTYTHIGDCADLWRRGLGTAGVLSSAKAQILLGLVLMSGLDDRARCRPR